MYNRFSEKIRPLGKSILHRLRRFGTQFIASFLIALMSITSTIYANPQNGIVVPGGSAVISSPNANTVQINQSSDRAIINWDSYNVATHETVHYIQPNSSSITLNRINPANGVSSIFGSINANGQVWLLNPAGIWFAPGSHVDVAGLLATTASINDSDFLAGRYNFYQDPRWNGSIVNQGNIYIREAGLAAFIGVGVVNDGLIVANMGKVYLGSASAYTVDFSGDQLIQFTVNSDINRPGLDQHGQPLRDAIKNSGTIIADGGKIVMSAQSASAVLDNVINMSGVAQARSVGMKNGAVVLSGGKEGQVRVSGRLIASGKNAGEKGGTVTVLGKQVALTDNALVDVSGDMGGGNVFIGGNAHGIGELQNADYAYLGKDVRVNANALNNGNGGNVVLWSDKGTGFYGTIYAEGGANGGNGGWVETSGKAYLEALGKVYAKSTNGLAGTWLLDPYDVTIANAATLNGGFSGGTFTPTGSGSIADVNTITSTLAAGTSVTITTDGAGSEDGSITLIDPLTYTTPTNSNAVLTLLSGGNGTIDIRNNITPGAGSGKLDIVLGDTNPGSGPRFIWVEDVMMNSNGGNISFNSIGDITILGTVNAVTGDIDITANKGGVALIGFGVGEYGLITTAGKINIATLNSDVNIIGTITTTSASNSALTIHDAHNVSLANINVPNGTFVLGINKDIGGAVIQYVDTSVNVNNIIASTDNTISLPNNTNQIKNMGVMEFVNSLELYTNSTLAVNGNINPSNVADIDLHATSLLTLNANIKATQFFPIQLNITGGGISQTTTSTIDVDGGNINFFGHTNSASVDLKGSLVTVPGCFSCSITFRDIGAIKTGNITTDGTIVFGFNSQLVNGDVTQNSDTALTTANLFLNTTGNVDLSNHTNAIDSVSIANSGSVKLYSNKSLVVNPIPSGPGTVGDLDINSAYVLTVNGNMQANSISFTGGSGIELPAAVVGDLIINVGAGDIALNSGIGTLNFASGNYKLYSTGKITLTTNDLVVGTSGGLTIGGLSGVPSSQAENVIIQTASSTTPIYVAPTSSVFGLVLNTSILNNIKTANLRLGSDNSGPMTIGTWTTPFLNTLTLASSSGITQTGALNVPLNLIVRGGGHAALTNAGNQFTYVSAAMTGSNAALSITNSLDTVIAQSTDDLGIVNGISGITADPGVTIYSPGEFIRLEAPISANLSNNTLPAITLASLKFDNTYGANALNPGSGYFYVWTHSPVDTVINGIPYYFRQYNATYGVTTPAVAQNGFLFETTLSQITISDLIGQTSKTYDGTTAATLANANFNYSGEETGDILYFKYGSANYNNKNVGTHKPVTVDNISIDYAQDGSGIYVYGYELASGSTTASGNIGEITQKNINIINVSGNNKTYDGTTDATLNYGSPDLSGVIAGDNVALNTDSVVAHFQTKDVGTNKFIDATGFSLSGSDASNYNLLALLGLTGDITAKDVNIINTTGNKIYDGTTSTTLLFGLNNLSGVIAGDNVTLDANAYQANFADKNVGIDKDITATGLTLSGPDAGNYHLLLTGIKGDITAKDINIINTTGNNKTYDGTRNATLLFGLNNLSGVVSGDNVTLDANAYQANFDDKKVGVDKAITATGFSLSGADANNYNLLQLTGLTADITAKEVQIINTIGSNKIYDGTMTATLLFGINNLSGVVAGDNVTLDANAYQANFADKNVGVGKSITATGFSLNGDDANNYSLSQLTGLTADITAKDVSIINVTGNNKQYDGTTTATVNIPSNSLSGIIAGDNVVIDPNTYHAFFASKNVANNVSMTADDFSLTGNDAGNYNLTTTSLTGLTGNITRRDLTIVNVTADNKVYDTTTNAILHFGNNDLSGVIAGEDIALDTSDYSAFFNNKNVGINKQVSATGFSLYGADVGNYNLLPFSGVTANITPKQITVTGITGIDKLYDGTTLASLNFNNAALHGVFTGDNVSLNGNDYLANFVTSAAGDNIPINVRLLVLMGESAGNYAVESPTGIEADIIPRGGPPIPFGPSLNAIVFPFEYQHDVDQPPAGDGPNLKLADDCKYVTKKVIVCSPGGGDVSFKKIGANDFIIN